MIRSENTYFHKCFCYRLYILFPETHVIARACAGTHPSKFTFAIYCTCKIIVFSVCFVIIIYFLWGEIFQRFFIEDYIQEIWNVINCKMLLKYFEKINCLLVSSTRHYLSLLDILLCSHFHEQCICLKQTWTSWLIDQLLTLHSTT